MAFLPEDGPRNGPKVRKLFNRTLKKKNTREKIRVVIKKTVISVAVYGEVEVLATHQVSMWVDGGSSHLLTAMMNYALN